MRGVISARCSFGMGGFPCGRGSPDLESIHADDQTTFGCFRGFGAPLWLIVYGVQTERARLTETDLVLPDIVPFILVFGLWLFSFPLVAYLVAMIFEKMDRVRMWTITRNWTVFALTLLSGLVFGLFALGLLPFAVANGVFFAAYFGVLAADIRLMRKVAGFSWGMAILLSGVIVAVGLTFIILALSR